MLEILIKLWNKKNREKQIEIKGTHHKNYLDLQNFSKKESRKLL